MTVKLFTRDELAQVCLNVAKEQPEAATRERLLRTAAAELRKPDLLPELLDALILALPYVETAETDPGYKPEAVRALLKTMRTVIALAEPRNASTAIAA